MLLYILSGVFSIVLVVLLSRARTRVLPGPRGLPVVGNLFQLGKLPYIAFGKWAAEYGPIFEIRIFREARVIISDYKMVKELFSQSALSGRPEFPIFDFLFDGKRHAISPTDGAHWEELRHFTLRQLRDLGFGKNSMEDSIMAEVIDLIQNLADDGTKVTNIKDRLRLGVLNALWFICTGVKYKQNDSKLLTFTSNVEETVAKVMGQRSYMFVVPGLPEMFPNFSGLSKIKKVFLDLATVFQEQVDEHVKTYSKDYPRDFSDAFLKEVYATTNRQSAFYDKLGTENLMAVLADLYFAGNDTTASTLSWMMIYLSKNPAVQQKLQSEIEAIIGNSRDCSLADKPNMPYTEAVISETLRYSSILPVSLPHRVMNEVKYKEYTFTKGTIVIPNLHFIHHDPAVWGDPENFRPERFLSEDEKTFKKHEALMPFSTGRRQCLGEALARATLFLFTTSIFQRFSIAFDHDGPDNGLEPEPGIVMTPKPFHLILYDRHK